MSRNVSQPDHGRRVLLYSDAAVFGGGERYLVELARGLPSLGYQVEVVASEEGAVDAFVREIQSFNVPVRRLPAIPTLRARGSFLKVFRFFLAHRFDLLHFNLVDPRACNGGMTAAWAALRRRFIVTEHLPRSPFDDKPLPFRHRLASHHTAVSIVNTEADKVTLEKRPHNRSRVVIVPNGISDPGEPTEARRRAARAVLGLATHEGPIVGFVGRFIPQKNPALFVEGLRRVLPIRPEVRFVMIGDGPELRQIQAFVSDLGFGSSVRFYGHRNDVRELLPGMELLVNTSRYEGMPFTILEAMAAGVPVLAQRIPGMDVLIAAGASGWLVAPEDGDVLGEMLLYALGDLERARRFGAAGRERALSLFSLTGMCQQTARAYDTLR